MSSQILVKSVTLQRYLYISDDFIMIRCCAFLIMYWRILFVLTFPIVALPIIFIEDTVAYRCMYVFVIICFFWITEAIPPPVTSLLPMVLFPTLGILGSDAVASNYMNDTNMMLVGSIVIAIAMEESQLHLRIALHVMQCIGCSIKRLHLGLCLVTMFISMWIANTAATALMLPIVEGILESLQSQEIISIWKEQTSNNEDEDLQPTNITMCYYISIAYCSLIGGTGCIIGSGSHLAFKGLYETRFPHSPGVEFAKWMMFNIPVMIIQTFLVIIWLQIWYLGLCRPFSTTSKELAVGSESVKAGKEIIKVKLEELGPLKFSEFCVGVCFLIAILLWFFRRPGFMNGWPYYITNVKCGDSVVAVFVMLLFFVIPMQPSFINFCSSDEEKRPTASSPSIIVWKGLEKKMHWGLLFILGGGFAMADAAKASGMTKLIANYLKHFVEHNELLVLIAVCCTASVITQFLSSNVACVTILTPIILDMTVVGKLHPMYLGLSNALACCYSFFLPVSTPPNALIVGPSKMRTVDMMKAGIGSYVICLSTLLIIFPIYAPFIWDLSEFPDWANTTDKSI